MPTTPGNQDWSQPYVFQRGDISQVAVGFQNGTTNPPDQAYPRIPKVPIRCNRCLITRPDSDVLMKDLTAFLGNDGTTATNQLQPSWITPGLVEKITSVVGDVVINQFPERAMSETVPQLPLLVETRLLGAFDLIRFTMYRAFGGDPSINTLLGLVDPGMVLGSVPGAFAFATLDGVLDLVTGVHARPFGMIMIMHPRMLSVMLQTARSEGWMLDYVEIDGFMYPTYAGIPIVLSYNVPIDGGAEGDETSIWVVSLGFENGGLFFIYPEEAGDQGVVIEKAQYGAGVDTDIWRVKVFTQLVLAQTTGLGQYANIQLPPPPT